MVEREEGAVPKIENSYCMWWAMLILLLAAKNKFMGNPEVYSIILSMCNRTIRQHMIVVLFCMCVLRALYMTWRLLQFWYFLCIHHSNDPQGQGLTPRGGYLTYNNCFAARPSGWNLRIYVLLMLGCRHGLLGEIDRMLHAKPNAQFGLTSACRRLVCTSRIMKNSLPGSPCTTIFWPSSNCTVSKESATVRRSHLSRDSVQGATLESIHPLLWIDQVSVSICLKPR